MYKPKTHYTVKTFNKKPLYFPKIILSTYVTTYP